MTQCSCIKKNFNFHFEALNTKTALFQDFSDWMSGEHYVKPERYTVEIKLPNRKGFKKKEVDALSFNKITSEDFGYSSCLPDGVYTFKTESCGNVYTRYKAITPDLECRVQCMLAKGIDPLKVATLSAQIKSIHYNAELDKIIEADKLYKLVKREIDLIECDCSCCK